MDEIMTGDVLYRKSDALGPFCIPFSKLVAILTKSLYSHASIVVKENGFNSEKLSIKCLAMEELWHWRSTH